MIKQIFLLTKFILSTAVTLSAVLSFVIYKGTIDTDIVLPLISIWLLALGVSALNQIQEYKEDSKMARTASRPVASGAMSVNKALFISFFLIIFSLILIYIVMGITGLAIFVFTIFMYNFVYTKLKKISIYAAVYGSILGVIPPMIGWISAGGDIFDIRFIAIGLLYFIWQIPHSWLLILKYNKDYSDGGFHTIADTFGIESLTRVTFVWILITMMVGVFVLYTFLPIALLYLVLIFTLHIYVLYSSIVNLLFKSWYKRVFIDINVYILLMMIFILLSRLS